MGLDDMRRRRKKADEKPCENGKCNKLAKPGMRYCNNCCEWMKHKMMHDGYLQDPNLGPPSVPDRRARREWPNLGPAGG